MSISGNEISDDENESFENVQFKSIFRCSRLVYSQNKGVERGGNLLLPAWVLDQIYYMSIPDPYMFKLTNNSNLKYSHAGVLEFTAEADQVCIPQWLMNHLCLKEGDDVTIESVTLPSATFCKIEALTMNAAYISDPVALLEENLVNYSCITEGDILFIYEPHKNLMYKMKVIETKPESAVKVISGEVLLDFDAPSKLQEKEVCKKPQSETRTIQSKTFPGQGYRLDGKPIDPPENKSPQSILQNRRYEKHEKPFVAFGGKGYTTRETKHKATEVDNDEPENKRHRSDSNKDSDETHQLISKERQEK